MYAHPVIHVLLTALLITQVKPLETSTVDGFESMPQDGDDCLLLVAENISDGQGNFYHYHRFSKLGVNFRDGDRLEYEIFLPEGIPSPKGGIDILLGGGRKPLRDARFGGTYVHDQHGLRAHGDSDLSRATGTWYQRKFSLDALAGGRSEGWYLVSEGDSPGCYVQFVDRVRVIRADGTVITVYEDGESPVNEKGFAAGYSKYTILERVKRSALNAAIDAPNEGDGQGSAKGKSDDQSAIEQGNDIQRSVGRESSVIRDLVESVKARGIRLRRTAELKTMASFAARVFAFKKRPLPEGLRQYVDSKGRWIAKASIELANTGTENTESANNEYTNLELENAEIEFLERILADSRPLVKSLTAHLVGHAHIDFQWLWEWPETLQVCRATFSQALKFMEEYEGYTFSQSSSGLYAATEAHFPELFETIRRRVAEGRWELVGGRVSEGDEHLMSAESHARQFLYGQRYFAERFGRTTVVGFEPDTFGHTAQMPQILRNGGCRFYYFCRGGVKEPLFWWEGLDGSRVLAFEESVTGSWYNAGIERAQLDETAQFIEATGCPDALWVYGVGNHGGGPTREHIENALTLAAKPCTPVVRFSTLKTFFMNLESSGDLDALPRFRGELNSRVHSGFFGTYTTHGDVKRWNREAERDAVAAETLAAVAAELGYPYPRDRFRRAWEDVAWNHHHDTICGTSIHGAYAESEKRMTRVIADCETIANEALDHLAARVSPPEEGTLGVIVFNPLARDRDGTVRLPRPEGMDPTIPLVARGPDGAHEPVQLTDDPEGPGLLFRAREIPSVGYRVYGIEPGPAQGPVTLVASETALENRHLRIETDPDTGRIVRMLSKARGREALGGKGAGFEIRFEDPHGMSAWVIGKLSEESTPLTFEGQAVIARGPVRSVLRQTFAFRDSKVTADLILDRDARHLEIALDVDWCEKGDASTPAPFLRFAADTGLEAPKAWYEVPFGAVPRPLDDEEVPALRWADLSDGTRGLALLNDCKHGYSGRDGTLRLSLIRSPYQPDPEPDVGRHAIRLGLAPHGGDWREGHVQARGEAFDQPLRAAFLPARTDGSLPPEQAFLRVGEGAVTVTGIKRAEDRDEMVVRCYAWGERGSGVRLSGALPLATARRVDFLERDLDAVTVRGGLLEERLPPLDDPYLRGALETPGRSLIPGQAPDACRPTSPSRDGEGFFSFPWPRARARIIHNRFK